MADQINTVVVDNIHANQHSNVEWVTMSNFIKGLGFTPCEVLLDGLRKYEQGERLAVYDKKTVEQLLMYLVQVAIEGEKELPPENVISEDVHHWAFKG